MLLVTIIKGLKMDTTTPSIYIEQLHIMIAEMRDRLIDHGDEKWLEDLAKQNDFDLYS
tara:strand:- start:152 stop:325 length:174 start_codon:yes stop_codon:yes gene_type:complete